MDDHLAEKIGRIDANVRMLLESFPSIQKLETASAINQREHKILFSILAVVATPMVLWVCKKLGIPIL